MSLELPKPIAVFVAAQNGDNTTPLALYFGDGAIVRDEGRTIQGLTAIEEWKAETKRKYQHTIEALASAEKDGRTLVTCRLTGNFPGSPIELQFFFSLEGGKIASLEIR